MQVENKVALITGGLGGIGLSLGKEFLRSGLKGVALIDINNSNLPQIQEELSKEFSSDKFLIVCTDITKTVEVENAFLCTIEKFENIDLVVNCAGISDEENWEKTIEVNYIASYRIMTMAMEMYISQHKSGAEGLIINIASIAGLDPMDTLVNYGATKSALIMLGRSLGSEKFYNKYKVKFLTICPSLTLTPSLIQFLKGPDEEFKELKEACNRLPEQSAEDLSKLIVEIMPIAENGSVWVCEGRKRYQMKFHHRTEYYQHEQNCNKLINE